MNMIQPINILKNWLEDEKTRGVPNPQQAVLSTATLTSVPHSRVVAIREITEEGLLFFTQKETRKVRELMANPLISLTFWFELSAREVIIEGIAEPLTYEENVTYWNSYPREAQIRFYSYAATSSQPIPDKAVLEQKKKQIELGYNEKILPISNYYCGFRIKPERLVFYSYRTDELSDVVEYVRRDRGWRSQCLSP